MTDGLAVLGAVLFVVVSLEVFRRWGWPAVAAVSAAAVAIVAAGWRRDYTPSKVSTSDQRAEEQRAAAIARRAAALAAREEADELQEAVDAIDDGAALVDHVTQRSTGDR